MAATVGWDAVVAGQCLRADQVEYAQFVGELPYFAFIAVHQRCMDDELFIHRQVQRHIERADESGYPLKSASDTPVTRWKIPLLRAMMAANVRKTMFLPGTKVFG